MEDYQFQRRGAAAAAAPLPRKVASGGRAKPAACYGDVFGGPPRSSLAPARPEDYREIFGAATACSIPVLDLPPPPGDGYELRQCSALDYLDIFGGFGGSDFAASYQELFASRDSNGAGATPLQAELGGAAPMTGNSETRGLKEMSRKKQEMPASEFIIEGPNEDQVGHLLNGVGCHLNDDADQLNSLNHMASYSKNDSVNRTIHKSQVHAIPGFAFVKNTEVDGPHTQADVDIFFDSDHSKGTSELQHLKTTMLAASFCKDVKYSVNDMKDHQRSSPLKISSSTRCPAYEENPSCSSENQSKVPRSNGFFSEVPNNHSVQENFIEKKTEGKCQNKTVLTCMSANCGNDLEIKCSASKDVPANQEHPSYSSNGHSASSVAKSSPDHLSNAKSSPNHFASDISIHAANVRIAETNHFKKSMSGPPPCTSSLSSEDRIAEQKKFNPVSSFPKDATANKSLNLHLSDTHSISSLGQSCSDGIFLTVSDINLQTQPSQGPPPGRPPPARPPSKSNLSGRNLRRTLTDYQKHDVGTGIAYKSHSFKQAVRDGSPPPFDVEIDASSAAAASVAAIEEAMELAQARLRSAKVSMERKKDNLQNRRKLGLNEDLRSINRNEKETVQENRRSREEVVVQLACEKTDGQKNDFGTEKMATVCSPSLLTGDFREHGSAEECGLSNLPVKREEKVGEWKVEEQFYEFIQSEKKLKKVPEDSLKEGTEKRTNAKIGIVGEEPNTSELKESGKLLAASKVVEWEGDNGKLQNLSVTTKKQIKNSQEATLESCMLGDCNLRRKETVNAHHQENKPGELQEPPETEQETKWRTSDEAFVCELSKNDLRVNNDVFNCKPVYVYQNPEKAQRGSDVTSGCEETKQEINETEKYLQGHEEENDNIVWGKSSELDENKMEAKMTHVSHVSSKDIHLKTVSKNCEDENLKMSLKANEYSYFLEGQEIEPEEARLLFGQDNGEVSSFTHQTFEWAENGNELKATLEVHDSRSNEKKFNVVLGINGCSSEAKRLKEIQKLPIETEEVQLKAVKQNTSSMEGIKDDFEGNITAAQKGYKKEINEIIKEVQVVDSNKVAKTAQDVCEGTGNEKKIGDARQAISLGEQQCIYKAPHDTLGNWDAGWPVYNNLECHETGNVNGVKMESEQARNLEKEREKEKEGEVRKLEEKEREHIKLEDERQKKRIELEEETERERKLEEAKEREGRRLKEEKERERRLEEEKEREWIRLEEERERERKKLQEMERKKLQEERERKKLEDEEIEKKLADEVRERKKLDEEREKKRLEEKRERKMLEEERERRKLEDEKKKKLEEERERRRLEEEERERRKLEDAKKKKLEEERERRLEEEERERRRLEEEEGERRRLEEEERERKQLEEAEERRKLEEEKKRKLEEERERKKLDEEERERMKIEEKEQMRKKQEEEDRERSKLEEKERERRKQEEERERRRLEEIERERRKLEEKVRERRRIEEEERERKLEEEKAKEKQKVEERAMEKKVDEERDKEWRKREEERERDRKKLEEERDREREREKDRQAVERATREAHERAFAEARERAERAAVERISAEARQRAMAEARERAEKASAETSEKIMADKASREARLRTERAAVERATAEARERAVEKAIADKVAQDARERAEKLATTSREGLKQSANISNPRDFDSQFQNGGNSYQRHSDSSHHASFIVEKVGGSEGDSAIRCKARMERHQRTVERAAKALAEKNLRDIIAQREQAERNRLAETLDADVKRWSNGKEGNLRALLSTLQYILGPESGWQPIPLTDVVTAPAVKKAYRKATLWVHPDKLQQRGASIQQKYICEKVFDLLKEAWNKFNSEER